MTYCVPPQAYSGHPYSQPRYQVVQPSWEACMAESDRRNRLILKHAKEKMWPNHWEFFCKAIEATPA